MVYCTAASRGDKGGQTGAFMRLRQSKLLRAIPHAKDIGSQEVVVGGAGRDGEPWGGVTGSPPVHQSQNTVKPR